MGHDQAAGGPYDTGGTWPGYRTEEEVSASIDEKRSSAALYRQRARGIELANESTEREKKAALASADEARIYTFVGEVDLQNSTRAILTIEQWVREDPAAPITIILNTPGGSLSDGFALYDAIAAAVESGVEVRTHATGSSLSMGAVLLQAGSRRTMSPNAWLMLHAPSSGSVGSVFALEDSAEVIRRMTEKLVDILVQKTGLEREKIEASWHRKDWWFSAEDAKENGLVDEVTLV